MSGHETDHDSEHTRPRRGKWRLLWLGLGVLALAGAGAGYWASTQEDTAEAMDESAGPADTAEVVRETISDTRRFEGTLGHGDAYTVPASSDGVVTGIADQGSAVERGTELYRVNEQPVIAMYGSVPMYRDLELGHSGVDVEQLVANLTELGYADCDTGDEFTWCVQEAVVEWQDDIGASETGSVARSDVVFVDAGSRVDTIRADVGGVLSPGTPVLDLTTSDQVVSLEVDVTDRDLLAVDTEVSVELPGGDVASGTVTAANVVPAGDAEEGSAPGTDETGGSEDSVAKLEVTLDEKVAESLLGGPADVVIDVDEQPGVLTVPVNALLALSDGGHGVEVVAGDGSTSIVPVETGLFADGRVEISGEGIDEGTVVGVAGR
ncbi:efflux RND transporter periplasmic adaptor subunit [Actinobacteria bacterium YIM 96077]|uniref:Efflux RND transporter periplasmic adaptor subunit n=1 Tax=Phytoactinopolyspora halophila TaxID=1981511 RepID=A0A329QH17_9ACTN|nr:efflux RND transporter periplasmic adaptor subunit [Phytoactinopolyspora halophila]AYY14147.1 efflux RND transporter periplasmic adaptor subunit [Actinobacteria bacterium YIM 96077]RAW09608.1 efflux RND transporter periplasmic adaptor subunit [Phytoactinopolyspora halophila]